MKKILTVISLTILILLTGCKSQHEKFTEQGINRLGNLELKSLLKNGWSAEFNIKKTTGSVTYHTDGTGTGEWDGKDDHTGKWHISGDQLCSQWNNWKQRCYYMYETEPGVFSALNTDGTLRGEFKTQ